jgi:hypothetical protein
MSMGIVPDERSVDVCCELREGCVAYDIGSAGGRNMIAQSNFHVCSFMLYVQVMFRAGVWFPRPRRGRLAPTARIFI